MIHKGLFFLQEIVWGCVCCPLYYRVYYLVKIEVIWLQIKFRSDSYFSSSSCSLVSLSIKFTSNDWSSTSHSCFLREKHSPP